MFRIIIITSNTYYVYNVFVHENLYFMKKRGMIMTVVFSSAVGVFSLPFYFKIDALVSL